MRPPALCCRTLAASDVPDGWSTSSVAYRASLDGPPFWLPLDIAESLPSRARPGFDFIPADSKIQQMPEVWVSRADAEAAAERFHGAAQLAELRATAARAEVIAPVDPRLWAEPAWGGVIGQTHTRTQLVAAEILDAR